MKIVDILVLLTSVAAPACAFHPGKSGESSESATAGVRNGSLIQSALEWKDQVKTIVVGLDSFQKTGAASLALSMPITLPAIVPEAVIFKLELALDPEKIRGLEVTGFATTGEDLSEKRLGVAILDSRPTERGTEISLRVTDFRTLLRDDREQRVFAHLSLKSSEGSSKLLTFHFVTPPSKIGIVRQLPVSESAATFERKWPGLRTLSSQAERRVLMETLFVQSRSSERVRLSVPFRIRSRIKLGGTRFTVVEGDKSNPHFTAHVQQSAAEKLEFETDMYIHIINRELASAWTGQGQKDLNSVFLNSGESIELGLYMTGDDFQRIEKYPASSPQVSPFSVAVNVRCHTKTIVPLRQDAEKFCNGVRDFWQLSDEKLNACKGAILAYKACSDSNFQDQPACREAALLDDQLRVSKEASPGNVWAMQLWTGCRQATAGNVWDFNAAPAWEWVPVVANLTQGLQTQPVVAEWLSGDISLLARFADGPVGYEPESRALVLLGKELKLRD